MATVGAKKGSSLGFYRVCMMDDTGCELGSFCFRSSSSRFNENLHVRLARNWSLDCVLNAKWFVFDARTGSLVKVHDGRLISSETGDLL